jgi:hypothetical protein
MPKKKAMYSYREFIKLTRGEPRFAALYEEAMKVETESGAARILNDCALLYRSLPPHPSTGTAFDVQRANIGYWAGYYSDATRSRVERLFQTGHPVFGKIDVCGPPTAKQAFEMGVMIARYETRAEAHASEFARAMRKGAGLDAR